MTAFRAVKALAFQLAAALERYEEHACAFAERCLDTELYRTLSAEIDEIQRFSASLPGISVAAVALLIAHSEFVYTVLREGDSQAARLKHEAAVGALRRACLRQIARSAN